MATIQEISRQVRRGELFDKHFERFYCLDKNDIPKGLEPRRERRNLARAYAAGEWRNRVRDAR